MCVTKTRIFRSFNQFLDWNNVCFNTVWRSLFNQIFTQFVFRDCIRSNDDTICFRRWCPVCCNLSMKKTCVDTSEVNFKFTITDDSSFWDSTLRCSLCSRRSNSFFSWVEFFRKCFNTVFRLFNDICNNLFNTCISVHHTLCVGLNKHWQIETCNDSHLAVWILTHHATSLVKWRTTPKVS